MKIIVDMLRLKTMMIYRQKYGILYVHQNAQKILNHQLFKSTFQKNMFEYNRKIEIIFSSPPESPQRRAFLKIAQISFERFVYRSISNFSFYWNSPFTKNISNTHVI